MNSFAKFQQPAKFQTNHTNNSWDIALSFFQCLAEFICDVTFKWKWGWKPTKWRHPSCSNSWLWNRISQELFGTLRSVRARYFAFIMLFQLSLISFNWSFPLTLIKLWGGGVDAPPPHDFWVLQLNGESNWIKTCRLFTFGIFACFKIIFKFISQLMLPWQWFKIRGVKNDLCGKGIVNFYSRNGISTY